MKALFNPCGAECRLENIKIYLCFLSILNIEMKGQSEIAYLPKFANIMLIVMVIVINEIF